MFFRNRGTLALAIAALVLVGYIGFLLTANYLSYQEVVKSAVSQTRQDMTKRAAAVSYFAAERLNDLKAVAAGRELAFYFANKALGMSMRYGLSANIDEIGGSFDRLLKEKEIGRHQIYTRIDFVSNGEDLKVSRSNPNSPPVDGADLWLRASPPDPPGDISIYRSNNKAMMVFSIPYHYKNEYMGRIVSWVDLDTVYKHLIEVTEESAETVYRVSYNQQYLPLPIGVPPLVAEADLPSPAHMIPGHPRFFKGTETNGRMIDLVAIGIPVENTPLFLTAITAYSDLSTQKNLWRLFLFLVFLSVLVLVGVGFLLRIKDQNLILSVRLDESTKQQEIITRNNMELQREIADRKHAEEELKIAKENAERASRTKSDFLAIMSHELRTPLHQIIGFTELATIDRQVALSEKQKRYLDLSIQSSRHLLSLINDILDLSKVEAGKVSLQLSEVKLSSLLEDCVVMVWEKALRNNLKLNIDALNAPETIVADERILRQILYNLLSNATKFTARGGSICLSAGSIFWENGCLLAGNGKRIDLRSGCAFDESLTNVEFVEVAVSDTGIGLRGEDLERIFNPFEQADPSFARRFKGTGLGLALTKEFVELHGGRIWAESDGPGKGSAFHFVIPIDPSTTTFGEDSQQ